VTPETCPDTENNLDCQRLAYGLAILLTIAGFGLFFVDSAISRPFATPPNILWPIKGDLRTLIALSEVFGHGTGVILITVAMFVLDRERRWRSGLLLATAFGAGLASNLAKLLVIARYRPHSFNFELSIWDSFYQWFPVLSWATDESLHKSALQSFPSAHAATAAGLCIGLSYFYPHARWYFFTLMFLAGTQRIVFAMHFPSDVAFGLALGLTTATLMVTKSYVPQFFRWIERYAQGQTKEKALSS